MQQLDPERTIYDFGMNNGDDLPYYLAKGTRVVGVEANASLCDWVRRKYSWEVQTGQLVIEHCVLSADQDGGEVDFYIHTGSHVLSQFPRPSAESIGNFEATRVRQRRPSSIVRQYGEPYYIKLDIEHYDRIVLQELFGQKIYPAFISSEIHDLRVRGLLQEAGYTWFNLVIGLEVSREYRNTGFRDVAGMRRTYSFPDHSAGPFGEDIRFPWLRSSQMDFLLDIVGPGWRDLHAARTRVPRSEIVPKVRLALWLLRGLVRRVRRKLGRSR
jgi:FkbM family methyltransferase